MSLASFCQSTVEHYLIPNGSLDEAQQGFVRAPGLWGLGPVVDAHHVFKSFWQQSLTFELVHVISCFVTLPTPANNGFQVEGDSYHYHDFIFRVSQRSILLLSVENNAAKKTIPRGCRAGLIPTWDDECQQLYDHFIRAAPGAEANERAATLTKALDEKRRNRWETSTENIDFSHSSRIAWQSFNRLTGRAKKTQPCPVSANAIASKLIANGRHTNVDKQVSRDVNAEIARLRASATPVLGSLSEPFSAEETTAAVKLIKSGKAQGPDKIAPEFITHCGSHMLTWLRVFFSQCMSTLRLPKIWRRSEIIAILKPKKPADDAKSYRPISLLCVPLKLLERLLLTRLNPVIDPQLPPQQAGFRHGRSTTDQVTLLTDDIEAGFEAKQKVGVVLVDLTAAYDTVWLRGLHLKLLRMVPDVHMVSFVMELLTNRSFKLKTSDGQVSRLRRLRNGVPQGSTLSPTLFNIYISDIPQTTSMQYGYADDLALLAADDSWEKVEETLNHDMQAITNYLQKWRLILSTAKTTSTAFHLNNRDSQRQLAVSVNGTMLPNCEHPVYLGVTLDRTLTYKHHIEALRRKVNVRNGLLRCLAGSTWGAYTSTLRTGALALVYSAAEYASPVWSRSAHTGKLDVSLNDSMRIITGCMRPTETTFLPVLAGIVPPDIRRESQVARLTKMAMDNPSHLLHDRVSVAVTYANEHEQRLKSRRPFSRHAAHLVANNYDPSKAWNDRIHDGPPFIRSACPPPSPSLPPGADLPRKQWVRLNRLRSGTARVGETLQLWGMQEAASCPCGHPTQTVEHVVTDCALLKSPGGLAALRCPNAKTRSWLSELPIELWWTLNFDFLIILLMFDKRYSVSALLVLNVYKMAFWLSTDNTIKFQSYFFYTEQVAMYHWICNQFLILYHLFFSSKLRFITYNKSKVLHKYMYNKCQNLSLSHNTIKRSYVPYVFIEDYIRDCKQKLQSCNMYTRDRNMKGHLMILW